MRTLILTHSDCDGICAGAIALSRFPNADVFFTKPVSLLSDLKNADADRIVITDIAINRRDAEDIIRLMSKKKSEILYFDHHPVADRIKKRLKNVTSLYINENASASELIYKYFQREIPRERIWIAIYGAIGDYEENTEFIEERILNWDVRALYFEASTIVLGIKHKRFESYDKKRMIVDILSKGGNPSDVPGLVLAAKKVVNEEFDVYEVVKKEAVKRGEVGYVKDLSFFGFRGPVALFASTVTDSRIGMSVYTRKNHLDITMRSRDYSVPLNVLADDAADAIDGSGGGHVHAAGARIPLGKLDDFIAEINRLLETKFRRK